MSKAATAVGSSIKTHISKALRTQTQTEDLSLPDCLPVMIAIAADGNVCQAEHYWQSNKRAENDESRQKAGTGTIDS
uniref:Uncharacterized protein n=1 Tax=Glossina palpalis gambiensis TaxID=67801 RepID=A0A1B0ARE0_9MUSC